MRIINIRLLAAACFALLQLLASGQTGPTNAAHVQIVQDYGKVPLRFEPNSGQTDPEIKYFSRGSAYTMYFAPGEVVLALDVSTNLAAHRHGLGESPALHRQRSIRL